MFSTSEIAQAVHEAVRVIQKAVGEEVAPHWEDAPEWMRVSTTLGVIAAARGTTPEASHEAWMRQRLAEGWVLGYVKNIEAKISPNLVPYAELDDAQKAKDHVLIAIVEAMTREEL